MTMARNHWQTYDDNEFKSMRLETHVSICLGLLDNWDNLNLADKNLICSHTNRLFMSA